MYLYKSYLKQRKIMPAITPNQPATTPLNVSPPIMLTGMTEKQRKERHLERKMFFMALTLCTISVLSRTIILYSYILYVYFPSFSNTILIFIINFIMFTLVPTSSIFVFYLFNKMFRKELNVKFLKKEWQNSLVQSNTQ